MGFSRAVILGKQKNSKSIIANIIEVLGVDGAYRFGKSYKVGFEGSKIVMEGIGENGKGENEEDTAQFIEQTEE